MISPYSDKSPREGELVRELRRQLRRVQNDQELLRATLASRERAIEGLRQEIRDFYVNLSSDQLADMEEGDA